MAQDDPFATPSADHTLILPTPGGRGSSPQPKLPESYDAQQELAATPSEMAFGNGLNPLLAAASPLLAVVSQLRVTLQHPNPQALRDELVRTITAFEQAARVAAVTPEKIIAARYVLCTLLDETASFTPWGGSGMWAKHSLLVVFHGEASGGEKFFLLLSKLAEQPKANRDILELMYVCLALGFQGRYGLIENSAGQLELLRERLAQILRQERGDYERDLSPRWQPTVTGRSRVLTIVPLWVAFAGCGLILLAAYMAFNHYINARSDPVFSYLEGLRIGTSLPTPPPQAAAEPRLARFLAPEIQQGLVSVRDEEGRSVVTLQGDGLFTPGSAKISPNFVPTLQRIAKAANGLAGHIQITGHTDNRPIRSTRFPSNWHLSLERARAVKSLLAKDITTSSRLSAEGRADAFPIASNETPVGRASNRRVEIIVTLSRAGT